MSRHYPVVHHEFVLFSMSGMLFVHRSARMRLDCQRTRLQMVRGPIWLPPRPPLLQRQRSKGRLRSHAHGQLTS